MQKLCVFYSITEGITALVCKYHPSTDYKGNSLMPELNQLSFLCFSSNVTYAWSCLWISVSAAQSDITINKGGGRQTKADGATRSHLLFLYTRWKSPGHAGLHWLSVSSGGAEPQQSSGICFTMIGIKFKPLTTEIREYGFRDVGRNNLLFI